MPDIFSFIKMKKINVEHIRVETCWVPETLYLLQQYTAVVVAVHVMGLSTFLAVIGRRC